ncbi:hypothetical protein SAMN05444008_1134 [Cnuella takakiae]|uniref:Uncharacterized protein n=1 Tax=Cnuella takakiae TaxID=1302690 RepID=A0A1M5F2W9_9BACT|nr:hypothetical protein [Cnuella takakiae]SHF85511.1 hypothetical protein SAMN05444008_1134 [Cnuella takakiae]
MPKQLCSYIKLLLAIVVLFMSAGMLLPNDTIGVVGKSVVQKEQAPHFLHLLAEVGEELSEEDSDDFHKIFLSAEGETLLPHQPSVPPRSLSIATYPVAPLALHKVARHLRLRVIRI